MLVQTLPHQMHAVFVVELVEYAVAAHQYEIEVRFYPEGSDVRFGNYHSGVAFQSVQFGFDVAKGA